MQSAQVGNSSLEGRSKPPLPSSLERACLCAKVAEQNKARDILVLDMRPLTTLYDFFVIATGNSRRQMHAISEDTDAVLTRLGDKRLAIEGYQASKWILQDFGDIIVHVFDKETRAYYELEELWANAPRIDWANTPLSKPVLDSL